MKEDSLVYLVYETTRRNTLSSLRAPPTGAPRRWLDETVKYKPPDSKYFVFVLVRVRS